MKHKMLQRLVILVTMLVGVVVTSFAQPTVISTSPAKNAIGASISTAISITFNEAMNASTLNTSNIKVTSDHYGHVAGSVSYNSETFTVTYDPTENLYYGQEITVLLTTGIQNAGGTSLAFGYQFKFKTEAVFAQTFAPQQNFNFTLFPTTIDIHDSNNDGHIDMVLNGTSGYYGRAISYGINQGNQVFSVTNISFGPGANKLIYADINGDNLYDIIHFSTDAFVNLNNGNGTFGSNIQFTAWVTINDIVAQDVDGDGDTDVIVSFLPNKIMVLKNNGSGFLYFESEIILSNNIPKIMLTDIDHDGDFDIVGSNGNSVSILLNNGLGNFTPEQTYDVQAYVIDMKSVDLNGDGFVDLAVLTNTGYGTFYFNNGTGTLENRTDFLIGSGPVSFDFGDFDNDGFPEMVVFKSTGQKVTKYKNDGGSTFIDPNSYGTYSTNSKVIVVDINKDGYLDVVGNNQGNSGYFILYGEFEPPVVPAMQATNVEFIENDYFSFNVSWTNGNGEKRLVVVRQESPVNADPVNNVSYQANSVFKQGTHLGLGNYVVYSGTENSVEISGLENNQTYHIAVYEYNGIETYETYLLTTPAIGSIKTLKKDDGSTDPGFGDGGTSLINTDAGILKTALQRDGKILSGGFKYVSGYNHLFMIRIKENGEPDETFGDEGIVITDIGEFANIQAIVEHRNGKIIVAGKVSYSAINEIFVARYNSNGEIDFSFGEQGFVRYSFPTEDEANDYANAIIIQPDNKILVGGRASDGGFRLIRLFDNGDLDLTFGDDGTVATRLFDIDQIWELAVQPDGKIVAVGTTTTNADFSIARYLPNGDLDFTFSSDGIAIINASEVADIAMDVKLQLDGKIVLFGTSNVNLSVVRLLDNGNLDPAFGENGRVLIDAGGEGFQLLYNGYIQHDGKIIAVGTDNVFSNGNMVAVRLMPWGEFDVTFNSTGIDIFDNGGHEIAKSVLIDKSGKIVVAGVRNISESIFRRYLNDQPVLEPKEISGNLVFRNIDEYSFTIRLHPGGGDHRIVLVKRSGPVNGAPSDFNSYEPNGLFGFGTEIGNGNFVVYNGNGDSIQVDNLNPNTKYFVSVFEYNGIPGKENYLISSSLNGQTKTAGFTGSSYSDGSLDPEFNEDGIQTASVDGNATIRSISFDSENRLIVAGESDDNIAIARLLENGSLDLTFNGNGYRVIDTDGGINRYGTAGAVVQSDDKVVVAGFYGTDGNATLHVSRLNVDGSYDETFNETGTVTLNGYNISRVYDIALQSDGKIILGVIHNDYHALIRLTTTGSLDEDFGSVGVATASFGSDNDAEDLVIQPDGKIVVVGSSNWAIAILRFDEDGNLDNSFNSNGRVIIDLGLFTQYGSAVALQSDNKIVVGAITSDDFSGDFTLIRLLSNGEYDLEFGDNGVVIVTQWVEDYLNAITIQGDGKIVAVGSLEGDIIIARFDSNGTLDTDFATDGFITIDQESGYESAWATKIQSDNKIVAGGVINTNFGIIRLAGSGGSDETYGEYTSITYNTPTTLYGDLSVTGNLNVNAKITTGFATIDLGETGILSGETPENYIEGNIQASRNLDSPQNNIAGLGISIDPQSNSLGNTVIRRETGNSLHSDGIKQVWVISPQNQPIGPVTVTLEWPSSFDNSVNLNDLVVFKSGDYGQSWDVIDAMFNTGSDPRTVTFTITSFSTFTIGETGSLPVELSSFSGYVANGTVYLNWSTFTETNNLGWEVESWKQAQNVSLSGNTPQQEVWTKVGYVDGKGTTTEKQSYAFTYPANREVTKYRLKQVDMDGKFSYSLMLTIHPTPETFSLHQNYPNPFNPVTMISYQIPMAGFVELKVFDVLGREVKSLVNEQKDAGYFTVSLTADHLATGVYFYKLTVGNFTQTKKMLLIK